MNKSEYISRVQVAIMQLHNCGAAYVKTAPVHEVFRGQTVWQGEVEVFDLHGHPKAKRAYAWSHREGPDDQGERFVTVLEVPPVTSPVTAVRASIMADAKKRKTGTRNRSHNLTTFQFYGLSFLVCCVGLELALL